MTDTPRPAAEPTEKHRLAASEMTMGASAYTLRETVATLLSDRDRLREELERAKARVEEVEKERDRMRPALEKIIKWLDSATERSLKMAKESRFITVTEACNFDAKNYGAMAKDLRKALPSPDAGQGERGEK